MTFASPFLFTIDPARPLLVMSCSDVKLQLAGWQRFADLYDGPMWRQVKLSGFPMSNVAAISALYGFLEPGYQIELYNAKMDEERSHRMCHTGNHVWRLAQAVKASAGAIVFGGQLYRALAQTAKRLEPELAIAEATGSYLEQRKQLGEWLRSNT